MTSPQSPRSSDLETLAAFIEGRLPEADRRRVEERLAKDEDYYEVYSETLETLEELKNEPAASMPSPVAPATGRRNWVTAMPLAATAILATGTTLIMWVMPRYSLGPVDPTGLSPLVIGASAWQIDSLDPTMRSGNEPPLLDFDSVALGVHLGAHYVDLRVALETDNPKVAESSARQLSAETRADLRFPEAGASLEELHKSLLDLKSETPLAPEDRDRWLEVLAEQNKTFEETFRLADIQTYRLGKWMESSRLAALGQDEAQVRKRLRHLPAAEKIVSKHFPGEQSQRGLGILEEIAQLLSVGKGDGATFEFEKIAERLESLIVELGRTNYFLD